MMHTCLKLRTYSSGLLNFAGIPPFSSAANVRHFLKHMSPPPPPGICNPCAHHPGGSRNDLPASRPWNVDYPKGIHHNIKIILFKF